MEMVVKTSQRRKICKKQNKTKLTFSPLKVLCAILGSLPSHSSRTPVAVRVLWWRCESVGGFGWVGPEGSGPAVAMEPQKALLPEQPEKLREFSDRSGPFCGDLKTTHPRRTSDCGREASRIPRS